MPVPRGQLVQALQADDRIVSAEAVATVLEGDQSGDVRIDAVIDLIGGQREEVSARVGR